MHSNSGLGACLLERGRAPEPSGPLLRHCLLFSCRRQRADPKKERAGRIRMLKHVEAAEEVLGPAPAIGGCHKKHALRTNRGRRGYGSWLLTAWRSDTSVLRPNLDHTGTGALILPRSCWRPSKSHWWRGDSRWRCVEHVLNGCRAWIRTTTAGSKGPRATITLLGSGPQNVSCRTPTVSRRGLYVPPRPSALP